MILLLQTWKSRLAKTRTGTSRMRWMKDYTCIMSTNELNAFRWTGKWKLPAIGCLIMPFPTQKKDHGIRGLGHYQSINCGLKCGFAFNYQRTTTPVWFCIIISIYLESIRHKQGMRLARKYQKQTCRKIFEQFHRFTPFWSHLPTCLQIAYQK